MSKEANLLNHQDIIYTSRLDGLTYIKSSKGGSANLYFSTNCVVNTKDNSVKLSYNVKAFEHTWDDHVDFTTTNYKEAVDKYNELAIRWNGHREIL